MMRRCHLAMRRTLGLRWQMSGIFVLLLFFLIGRIDAQTLRDPTLPPVEAGLSSTSVDAKSQGTEPGAMTIIVRSGRPYLVVATRLYAQGQKLGRAHIERISETEVWLREGGVLRKVPQFPGIQRRTVIPVAASAACAASASRPSSPVAPCVHSSGLSQ